MARASFELENDNVVNSLVKYRSYLYIPITKHISGIERKEDKLGMRQYSKGKD